MVSDEGKDVVHAVDVPYLIRHPMIRLAKWPPPRRPPGGSGVFTLPRVATAHVRFGLLETGCCREATIRH
jgi:hypothetical protein